MAKQIEIFRAGKQTDSKGKSKTWTEADLDKIVSAYNENKSGHEAPLVIGHPKTDAPAYGWVKSLSRKGSSLFMETSSVVKEFQEAVNKGMFKKRSISLYPNMTLKHVGFLGAVPPAVKGLEDFQFNEAEETLDFEVSPEDGSEEFADFETSWGFRDVGRTFRALREYLIGKGEKEAADEILPNYRIKGLEDFKDTDSAKEVARSNFEEEPQKGEKEMKFKNLEEANQKIEELEKENSDFSEKNESLSSDLDAANKRAEDAEAKLQEFEEQKAQEEENSLKSEISSFCEGLVKNWKTRGG